MDKTIGEILVEAVEPIVPIFLNQAEEDVFPYSVYEISESEQRDKQGPYLRMANVTVYVTAGSNSEMKRLSGMVQEAIKRLQTRWVTIRMQNTKDANDGSQWINKTDYNIAKLI